MTIDLNNIKRINYIDATRGLALFLVIISHIYSNPLLGNYWTFLYNGYIAVFFIIVGVTSGDFSEKKNFIVSKACRLILPYFIYGISLSLITYFINGIDLTGCIKGLLYGRWSVIRNPLSLNMLAIGYKAGLPPLWYLPFMFNTYILAYCYDKIKVKRSSVYLFFGFIILWIISGNFLPIMLPWSIDIAPLGFLLIIIGRIIGSSLNKINFTNIQAGFSICILFIFLYIQSNIINPAVNLSISQVGNRGILSPFLYLVTGTIETLLFLISFKTISQSIICDIFTYIGRHSLRLFCLHLFIHNQMSLILSELYKMQTIGFFISFVSTLVVDYIIQLLFERFKGIRIFRYL